MDSKMKITVFLVIVSSFCVSDGVKFDSTLPDTISDLVLTVVRLYLNANNDTIVPIPNVDEEFRTFAGLKVEFIANNGVFRNPASVERIGETEILHGDKKYLMTLNIGFKTMTIYFPDYTARVLSLSENGEIYIKIGKNAMVVQVTVVYSPKCIVTVNEVKMTTFEDLSVSITGLGILNNLEAQIVRRALEAYKNSFTPIIENVVNVKLQEVFPNNIFCKFKPS